MSLVEKVSGMVVLWLTEFQVDLSNSHSRIVDGSLESKSLFFFANNLSTKQEKNQSLVMLWMDGHAQIQRWRWEKEGRNSERVKWSSAILPVQCCLFLGNLSIALCLKSCLLVFWFLGFYLLPWSNFWFLSNLQFSGTSLFRGGAFTSMVVTWTTD